MDLTQDEIGELNRRLDAEWDVDRVLHLIFGGGVLLALLLSRFHHPRWWWLTLMLAKFAFWTAVVKWSQLKGLLQRVGVRTRAEIERERYGVLFGAEPPGAGPR